MKWSKLKASVESCFADELKGRVRLHTTGYRRPGRFDDEGRAWITIDGKEIINMPLDTDFWLYGEPELENESRLGQGRLWRAVSDYPDLSINKILESEDSVVRALGMLDRRLGKRRLAKLDLSTEPPLVQYLYLFRCEIDNVRATIPDERKSLLDHLTKRHVFRRQYQEENRERLERNSQEADQALANATTQNLQALIRRIGANEIDEDELRTEVVRTIYNSFQQSQNPDLICQLLTHVEKTPKLLASKDFTTGVICLARNAKAWLRPCEQWIPRSHNARKQFSSLARHLWANYDVPIFMDQAWTQGTEREQVWFRHLGIGQSIRTASELPIQMTKKMAHHFCQAPGKYSIPAAFRWSQVHALGGDRRLADALRETRLAREFQDDDFWLTVLRFFVNNPMLDTAHVNPIVDYIWNQRFQPVVVFVARGVAEERPPEQPNFSMCGRTADSILRAVEAWHRRLGTDSRAGDLQWRKSNIEDFEYTEGTAESRNTRHWRIRELVNSKELVAEGRQMEHCVSSYSRSCHAGKCSIWTMEVETQDGVEKCVTIEVSHSKKQICQVRGKRNRHASTEELGILRRWASLHDLQIADYIQ